jgi:hypothetical protein
MGSSRFKMQNWTQYSKALVNRGSLTIWFDKESIANWYSENNAVKRGRPCLYSDLAIECCLTLRAIFKLPLRATIADNAITIVSAGLFASLQA